MASKDKTLSLWAALNHMRGGQPLLHMHTRLGAAWFVVPAGQISDETAKLLLERPDIQPTNDSSFPGCNQTFCFIAIGVRPARN